MTERKTAQGKKKIRKRKTIIEHCWYLIEITSGKAHYNLSENRGKHRNPGPYSEYSSLEIRGTVLEPPKIAGRDIECTFYGERGHDLRLNQPEEYADDRYTLVGRITTRKDSCCYFTGWMPASMLMPVAQMTFAGEFRYLRLLGPPLYRNEASIHDYALFKDKDDE